jgi:N-acetylmuramoyl-L-alanine amidase
MVDLSTLDEVAVLCLTIYGEARGEPIEGQIAVGCVIRNRVRTGMTYHQVCLAPMQFSCWNIDDPNYLILMNYAEHMPTNDSVVRQCMWVATGIKNGDIMDNTRGALHYLTEKMFDNERPQWARVIKSDPVQRGSQVFFNV